MGKAEPQTLGKKSYREEDPAQSRMAQHDQDRERASGTTAQQRSHEEPCCTRHAACLLWTP
jgi:hypothetical protein